jgi:signal transduction histidine kinase
MSVTGLQTLIDNLLESSSIEAGHFRIRRQQTDFHMVVEESVQMMAPLLARRRQQVLVEEPADIPAAAARSGTHGPGAGEPAF